MDYNLSDAYPPKFSPDSHLCKINTYYKNKKIELDINNCVTRSVSKTERAAFMLLIEIRGNFSF